MKAQIISLDFLIGAALFLVFMGAFALVLTNIPQQETSTQEDLLFAHTNLEKNLQATADPFYKDYRVDEQTLEEFKAADHDLTALILGDQATQGIGLSPEGHRTCLTITDEESTLHEINDCETITQDCARTTTVSKPALLDTGDYADNKLVQVHITACKK